MRYFLLPIHVPQVSDIVFGKSRCLQQSKCNARESDLHLVFVVFGFFRLLLLEFPIFFLELNDFVRISPWIHLFYFFALPMYVRVAYLFITLNLTQTVIFPTQTIAPPITSS